MAERTTKDHRRKSKQTDKRDNVVEAPQWAGWSVRQRRKASSLLGVGPFHSLQHLGQSSASLKHACGCWVTTTYLDGDREASLRANQAVAVGGELLSRALCGVDNLEVLVHGAAHHHNADEISRVGIFKVLAIEDAVGWPWEHRYIVHGIVHGIRDDAREEVASRLATLQSVGIRVIMLPHKRPALVRDEFGVALVLVVLLVLLRGCNRVIDWSSPVLGVLGVLDVVEAEVERLVDGGGTISLQALVVKVPLGLVRLGVGVPRIAELQLPHVVAAVLVRHNVQWSSDRRVEVNGVGEELEA